MGILRGTFADAVAAWLENLKMRFESRDPLFLFLMMAPLLLFWLLLRRSLQDEGFGIVALRKLQDSSSVSTI